MGDEPEVPFLRLLTINRFRGIESLSWRPSEGANVILGGGDVGKTTILEAVSLLLSPSASVQISDCDFWERDVTQEFSIQGVFALPPCIGMSNRAKIYWPWEWDGENAVVPKEGGGSEVPAVYCLRVRGSTDLESIHEVVQPDGSTEPLTVGLRRAIGLVRLAADDRSDRDLRLVQGAALDRALGDKELKGRLGAEIGKQDIGKLMTAGAQNALTKLDTDFKASRLPDNLGIGFTGAPGLSLNALVGLTSKKAGYFLPLICWGAGTRRLASLRLSEGAQSAQPLSVVDEIERGLEPYRQRLFMKELSSRQAQSFITTHSSAVLAAAAGQASLWYMGANGTIGALCGDPVAAHLKKDPEAFLSRITIVAEGITEVGFIKALLKRAFKGASPEEFGIHVSDGGGNESALKLLKGLMQSDLKFAAVVDDEGKNEGAWREVEGRLQKLLLRWSEGCLEEAVISHLQQEQLEQFVMDPAGELTGYRLRTLALRMGIEEGKDWGDICAKAGKRLPELIVEAATGHVPSDIADKGLRKAYEKHSRDWFKTETGGAELEGKMFSLGAAPALSSQILPFLNAVFSSCGLSQLPALEP